MGQKIIMNIKKESEDFIQWVDNSLSTDIKYANNKIEYFDKLEKIDNSTAKFSIFLVFTIWANDNTLIFKGTLHGQYKVEITKEMTLNDYSFFYKRPYVVFKLKFDNYKKGQLLDSFIFPEFDSEDDTIVFSFKNKLPDTLSSSNPSKE